VSPSTSVSSSASSSPSISPSLGYAEYTRGDYAVLPADDTDLETVYSAQDYTDVDTLDDIFVDQDAAGEFALHQFKDHSFGTTVSLRWDGKSTRAPSISPVYLQIYNRLSTAWDTVTSNNAASADTVFSLTGQVPLTNYKDGNSVVSCRVYQEAV
jgi:hypothetical protein